MFLAPPEAQATGIPIFCVPFVDLNCLKEMLLDLIARLLLPQIIKTLIQDPLLSAIKGGKGEYIPNFEAEILKQVDKRAGEVMANLSKLNFCGDNKLLIDISLNRMGLAHGGISKPRFDCTAAVNLGVNFVQADWDGFFSYAGHIQNSPGGALLIAEDAYGLEVARTQEQLVNRFNTGEQFLGKTKTIQICEESGLCHTEYKATTPGQFFSDSVQKGLDAATDFLTGADEIQEMIAGVITSLIDQLVGGDLELAN